jgi:hypothetical protein
MFGIIFNTGTYINKSSARVISREMMVITFIEWVILGYLILAFFNNKIWEDFKNWIKRKRK